MLFALKAAKTGFISLVNTLGAEASPNGRTVKLYKFSFHLNVRYFWKSGLILMLKYASFKSIEVKKSSFTINSKANSIEVKNHLFQLTLKQIADFLA